MNAASTVVTQMSSGRLILLKLEFSVLTLFREREVNGK